MACTAQVFPQGNAIYRETAEGPEETTYYSNTEHACITCSKISRADFGPLPKDIVSELCGNIDKKDFIYNHGEEVDSWAFGRNFD